MSPARCHEDSCTVKWSEVQTLSGPAYKADVPFMPPAQGGILCDVSGVRVLVSQQPGNILQIIGDGMYAGVSAALGARVNTFEGPQPLPANYDDWVDVPRSAGNGNPVFSDVLQVTNPLNVPTIAVVAGNFSMFWSVRDFDATDITTDAGANQSALTPYNAQMKMRAYTGFATGGPYVTSVSMYRDLSGLVPTPAPANREEKGDEPFFSFPKVVGPGATLFIKGSCNYQGEEQAVNTAFDGTSAAGQKRGFRLKEVTATFIPAA